MTHSDKKDNENISVDQMSKCALAKLFLLENANLSLFHKPFLPMKLEVVHCVYMQ